MFVTEEVFQEDRSRLEIFEFSTKKTYLLLKNGYKKRDQDC